MDAVRDRTPYRLLTRLFLRQFLENDLISPDADRSQLLAVVGAGVVSLTLFASVMMSFNYVIVPPTPGRAAVLALDDRFFYVALAMLVTALVAVSQWDALAVGIRDAAILEPLSIPAGVIRRAKLSAVAILGGVVALAVNAFPSVVFPLLLVFNFRQMRLIWLVGLIGTHALVTIAAAIFGYVAVIALRESLAAVLGPRGFARVSPWAQGTLIVVLGASLLLLPPAASGVGEKGFDGWRPLSPPMWFLGAYELAAGGVIADLPRAAMTSRQADSDRRNSALYQHRRREFAALALRAALALAIALAAAAAASVWNARRLPSVGPTAARASRRRSPFAWQLAARLAPDAAVRAGFFFTLAAMWRSHTHRLTLACAAAVGFALAVVAVSGVAFADGVRATPRFLAVQPLLFGALLVGFRHAIRVPAELRANWGVQLAWRGRERAFLVGVRAAALTGLALPAIGALLPLYGYAMGFSLAVAHAAWGLAGAVVLLEALMVTYDKVPFVCTYLPSEPLKALAPIYAVAFVVGASIFARMQLDALFGSGAMILAVTLALALVALRIAATARTRLPWVEFDEAPATLQRLGLDG
jgi:hypothetical protein